MIGRQRLHEVTGCRESTTYDLPDTDLPPNRDIARDAEMDAEAEEANLVSSAKSPFTAWEYADRTGRHDPRLQQAVAGSVYEPHYRERFYNEPTAQYRNAPRPKPAPVRRPMARPAQKPAQQQQQPPAPGRSGIRAFFDRFRRR